MGWEGGLNQCCIKTWVFAPCFLLTFLNVFLYTLGVGVQPLFPHGLLSFGGYFIETPPGMSVVYKFAISNNLK